MKTVSGHEVEILNRNKAGMSTFKVFGTLEGIPCHWTTDGKYRMDDKTSEFDLEEKP